MVTIDGESLGSKEVLKFGQKEYRAVISASTNELASKLIKQIS